MPCFPKCTLDYKRESKFDMYWTLIVGIAKWSALWGSSQTWCTIQDLRTYRRATGNAAGRRKLILSFMCLSQSLCSCLYSVTWRCRLLSWWGLGLVLKKRTSDLFTGSRVFHCYNWLLLNQSKDIAPNSWKRKLHYYIFQSKDQSWERNRKETLSLLHRSKRWVLFTLSDQRVILLVILVMSVILGYEKNQNL